MMQQQNMKVKKLDGNSDNVEFILEDMNSLLLNSDEQKRATDARFVYNFTHFPNTFKDITEALDVYNSMGYPHNIQFKQYELKKVDGKIYMFSLWWSRRDQPKYHHRFNFQQNSIKLSECNVNIRFTWNELWGNFIRKEPFKIVHDHNLELDERVNSGDDIVSYIKTILMNERNIKISDVNRRVQDKFGQDLDHLEILNIIKLIKGDKVIEEKELISDLQKIKDYDERVFLVINNGIPSVVFVQQKEMMDKFIKHPEVILMTVSAKRKNKYGYYIVHFTGINSQGNPITFGIGFLDIKCVDGYTWILNKFLERAKTYEVDPPKVIITNFEEDIEAAIHKELPNWMHLVSQYYIVSKVSELLKRHQKRPEFDRLSMLDKIESIVLEVDPNIFETKVHEYLKLISFDTVAERIVEEMFRKHKKWTLFSFKDVYTAGLHSYERAEVLENFNRGLKYDHTILQIIELNVKLETRDWILQCNSKEAHAYMTHPVYLAISKNFSLYATAIMLHQMIESYKYIAYEEDSCTSYRVVVEPNKAFQVTLTVQKIKTQLANSSFSDSITEAKKWFDCSCPFFTNWQMICSHIFCTMNLLQIKNINNFAHLQKWRDTSSSTAIPDQQKMNKDEKFLNFIEHIDESKKKKRTKHKGGKVPMRKRKKGMDFYDEKKGIDGSILERPTEPTEGAPDSHDIDGKASGDFSDDPDDFNDIDEDMAKGFDSDLLKFSEQKIEGIDYVKDDHSSSDSSDSDDTKKNRKNKKSKRKNKKYIPGKNLEEKLNNIKPKAQLLMEEKVKDAPKRKTRRDTKKEGECNDSFEGSFDQNTEMSIENNTLIGE